MRSLSLTRVISQIEPCFLYAHSLFVGDMGQARDAAMRTSPIRSDSPAEFAFSNLRRAADLPYVP